MWKWCKVGIFFRFVKLFCNLFYTTNYFLPTDCSDCRQSCNYSFLLFANAPFGRVEIVSTAAQVVDKAEGMSLIGEKGVAARCRGGKRDGFGAQVGQGCFKIDFDCSKLAAVEEFANC